MGKKDFDKDMYFMLTDIDRQLKTQKGEDPTVYVYIGDTSVPYASFEVAYQDMEKASRELGKESACFKEVLQQMEESPFEKRYYSVSGFKKMIEDIDSYGKSVEAGEARITKNITKEDKVKQYGKEKV